MLAICLGLSKMNGKSQKTGNQYEMHRLLIAIPAKNVTSGSFNRFALGYETMDLDVSESAFPVMAGLTYPCRAELRMDHEPRGGKLVAVVGGVVGKPVYIPLDVQAAQ